MLTRELLKHKTRGTKVFPEFVAPDDVSIGEGCKGLIAVLGESIGQVRDVVEERLGAALAAVGNYPGLVKILLDRCKFDADFEAAEHARWQYFVAAQTLRNDGGYAALGDFQEAIGAHFDRKFSQISNDLYADLPGTRQLLSVEPISHTELINRYNCGQVQGLLLGAKQLTFRCKLPSIGSQRAFYRTLKFHQLIIADYSMSDLATGRQVEVRLEGPGTIFESNATYGAKFANILPHFLHFPEWELTAEVSAKKKNFTLALKHSAALKSYLAPSAVYVPEEIGALVAAFNRASADWKAELGGNFIDLGGRGYAVSDLAFCREGRQGRDIELFHKWHAHQLLARLQQLENCRQMALIIGVSKAIATKPEVARVLDKSQWFAKNGFIFRDFPSTRQLLEVLNREEEVH